MTDIASNNLRNRNRAETRFRWYGRFAIGLALLALLALLCSIFMRGYTGFLRSEMALEVYFDPAIVDINALPTSDMRALVRNALDSRFPGVTEHADRRLLHGLLSNEADNVLRQAVRESPALLGATQTLWLPASSQADLFIKGVLSAQSSQSERKFKDIQIGWIHDLQERGQVRTRFNTPFFTAGDSREPEQAGFGGSIIGSVLTLLVCIGLAFPLGVMTAVYLEEFAPRNRLVDLIEVNINNLAAVPSIVFGLLGLAVFLNVMGLPRSAPVVGGLTLALMTLPIIIITTRVALKAVPPSIREAARALGASELQVALHQTLPLAMPGIMTGTILGMARAMGETAPLLLIGMVAFVVDIPSSFTDPATAMPVQVYLWASSPEAGFVEKTSAGILVLLGVLAVMNSLAIYVRKRFEIRW